VKCTDYVIGQDDCKRSPSLSGTQRELIADDSGSGTKESVTDSYARPPHQLDDRSQVFAKHVGRTQRLLVVSTRGSDHLFVRLLSKGRVTLSSGLIALRSAAGVFMIQRILTQ